MHRHFLAVALLVALTTLLGCGRRDVAEEPVAYQRHADKWRIHQIYPNRYGEVEVVDMFSRFDNMAMLQKEETTSSSDDPYGTGWFYTPAMVVPIGWDELIVSYNADRMSVVGVDVVPEGHVLGYGWCLPLGTWTFAPDFLDHRSSSNFKTNTGRIEDGLVKLETPAEAVQLIVRLELRRYDSMDKASLKLLTISFFNGGSMWPQPRSPNRQAWGKHLLVPKKPQLVYKNGAGWSAPCCTSMVLGYWARRLNCRSLQVDVPAVAYGVRDSFSGHTGNWSFNAAYAGSFPQLKSYVRRLRDLVEVENEIAQERPVIAAVDENILLGKDPMWNKPRKHLVVVTGFTNQGDLLVNDPLTKTPAKVQRVYKRDVFDAAWRSSFRAAILTEPVTTD